MIIRWNAIVVVTMKPKSSTKKIMDLMEVKEITHNPLTIPTSPRMDRSQMSLAPVKRICFRGDSRLPKELFKTGFQVREGAITERLYKEIKAIKHKHLDSIKKFDPRQFLKDMDALKKLVQTDATSSIVEEYEKVPELYYESWIDRMLWQVKQGNIGLEDEEDFKTINNDTVILKPFHSQQVIATAKRFKSALLFPISSELSDHYQTEKSYVYAVYVDEGFDTHMHGIVSSLLHSKTSSESDLQDAFQKLNPTLSKEDALLHVKNMLAFSDVLNMSLDEVMDAYVEEIVVPSIPSEHIIAAIPVERKIKILDDKYCQGSYRLSGQIEINPDCSLSPETINQVTSFLQEEQRLNAKALQEKNPSPDARIIEPTEGFHEGFSPKITKG
ncbi:hypothetical protein Lspi_1153 [Legionella spiritensis]|uniref:Uncharacterized protein n=2 Tax=Legionella spiritensis TaxID=452 RepID=A0A0W0Z5B6_LEGSP|nr:hypothetical protein Lspi_1153 [Legionella spiritensis]SNV46432.1 Uncharacterised protein [Legionella spiritensis]